MKQGTTGCTRIITFGQLLKLVPCMCLRFITPNKWESICILLSIPHLLRVAPRQYWLSGTFREFIPTLPWYVGKVTFKPRHTYEDIWRRAQFRQSRCWAVSATVRLLHHASAQHHIKFSSSCHWYFNDVWPITFKRERDRDGDRDKEYSFFCSTCCWDTLCFQHPVLYQTF